MEVGELQLTRARRQPPHAVSAPKGAAGDELFLELGDAPEAPCLGDSGGPALITGSDGTERLAGITSFATDGCAPGSRATNLAKYLPFVLTQVEESERPDAADVYVAGGGCRAAPARGRSVGATWIVALMASLAALRRWARRGAGRPSLEVIPPRC